MPQVAGSETAARGPGSRGQRRGHPAHQGDDFEVPQAQTTEAIRQGGTHRRTCWPLVDESTTEAMEIRRGAADVGSGRIGPAGPSVQATWGMRSIPMR